MALSSFSLFAHEVGNGGDVVICKNTNEISVEILDFYEGYKNGNLVSLYDKDLTHEQYIQKLADLLELYDYSAFKDFRSEALNILDAFNIFINWDRSVGTFEFTYNELPDIPDSKHTIDIENGCELKQLVIRKENKYQIQANLFLSLSKQSLRGIILHETLYRIFATEMFAKDSRNARYLVQKFSSQPLEDLTLWKYLNIMRPVSDYIHYLSPSMNDLDLSCREIKTKSGIYIMKDSEMDLALTKKYGAIRVEAHLEGLSPKAILYLSNDKNQSFKIDLRPSPEEKSKILYIPLGKYDINVWIDKRIKFGSSPYVTFKIGNRELFFNGSKNVEIEISPDDLK